MTTLEVILAVITSVLGCALGVSAITVRRLASRSDSSAELDFARLSADVERLDRGLREETERQRTASTTQARELREELAAIVKRSNDSLVNAVGQISQVQKTQLESITAQLGQLTSANERKLESVRSVIDQRLKQIHDESSRRLEQIRQTVDEKLHGTLEKRLGESFKIVSDRLELVHKGLGEMQTLAAGVGDLKRVLTNVSTRGALAEIQLGAILEQILIPEQYERNVAVKPGSAKRVEFAIKLPGPGSSDGTPLWLPIDAKFPMADYERLVHAQEQGDVDAAKAASKDLARGIKSSARDIHDKYIDPPHSTDFALMYLGTEGLYAEVIRQPDLFHTLQRDYHVVVVGPTTLAAVLNSLQMGFRTLAIQQRTSEIWELLTRIKVEFSRFGDILDDVQTKIGQAASKLELATRKSHTIERRLKDVESLPESTDTVQSLMTPESLMDDAPDDDSPTAAGDAVE